MKKILDCRRSSLALVGMLLLAGIALYKGHDVSMAISSIVLAVAASNAYQGKKENV